jgi:hypothetical protein
MERRDEDKIIGLFFILVFGIKLVFVSILN